ncbi:lamin tail domain-containing protein, partial [Salmonella sp. SAL4449]|uniref:lamin tail domain-containing protein n=1 Tax=Salmonella sp. SAL4449 TaxID=3159904 RepID=UPI00397E4D0E
PGEGSTDDFVELRNDSASPVDVSGWRINEWTPASGVRLVFVVPGGVVMAPGCHYLVSFRPDVGGVVPDARMINPINDQG